MFHAKNPTLLRLGSPTMVGGCIERFYPPSSIERDLDVRRVERKNGSVHMLVHTQNRELSTSELEKIIDSSALSATLSFNRCRRCRADYDTFLTQLRNDMQTYGIRAARMTNLFTQFPHSMIVFSDTNPEFKQTVLKYQWFSGYARPLGTQN